MNNNPTSNQIDDSKTIAEYKAIIFQYRNFGVLNRSDAIEKYKKFNSDHPEYCAAMTVATTVSGTATSIDQVTNDVIIDNLCTQLLYLTGKNVWEEKNNGKSEA